jgi:ribonuclease P/MRP protein subunit POP3
LTLGFNATTAHLESEIQEKAVQRMRVVFVARGDTSSAHLYAHFPLLSSMLSHVRLVSLAKGAEARLCETLQMRRVGVVGLLDDAPGADTLFQLVEDKVPKIEHPWVHEGMPSFVPTRVKWVETVVNQAQTGKPEPRKKPKEIHVVDDKI